MLLKLKMFWNNANEHPVNGFVVFSFAGFIASVIFLVTNAIPYVGPTMFGIWIALQFMSLYYGIKILVDLVRSMMSNEVFVLA